MWRTSKRCDDSYWRFRDARVHRPIGRRDRLRHLPRGRAEEAGLAEAHPDREYAPLTVDVGAEQVIEGIEEGLVGLEAGETTTLTIPPEKAYDERSEERIQEFETEELREMLGGQTPEEGAYLEAQNGQHGEVVHSGEAIVRVDFNPRLAGTVIWVFAAVGSLTAIAYTSMLHVVDWVTIGLLAYPVEGVAPFAVITGAILTIPIVVPTALISMKLLR